MKKQFLAVFFVLSLMGMASVLQAQTGPDFAYANYMEYGSPMWVSPVEGAAPSPLIEAVQVSVDGPNRAYGGLGRDKRCKKR